MSDDQIDDIVARINDATGKRIAVRLGGNLPESEVVEVLPTPLSVVNEYILGTGGLPVGRMLEVFSEEGVGKSAFSYGCLAATQQAGGVACLIETESRLSRERLETFKVNTDDLVLTEPDTIEEMLETVGGILASSGTKPILIAIDSIAAAPAREEIEEGLVGKAAVAARARVLTRAIRVMAKQVVRKRVCILATNHQKTKIGVVFGDKTTTPGGDALKFYATTRLRLMGGTAVKRGETHIGKDVTVLAVKNILASPWRKAKIRLMYEDGWDDIWTTMDHAKTVGAIEKGSKRRSQEAYQETLGLLEECSWLPTKKTKKKSDKNSEEAKEEDSNAE